MGCFFFQFWNQFLFLLFMDLRSLGSPLSITQGTSRPPNPFPLVRRGDFGGCLERELTFCLRTDPEAKWPRPRGQPTPDPEASGLKTEEKPIFKKKEKPIPTRWKKNYPRIFRTGFKKKFIKKHCHFWPLVGSPPLVGNQISWRLKK